MPDIQMYLVGGAVRDRLLAGEKNYKDLDFSVVALDYDSMKRWLVESYGVGVYLEQPEYGTIRGHFTPAHFHDGPVTRSFHDYTLGSLPADFVLARKDGYYRDGRRPEDIEAGTLYDDLARRDFTVNAIAMDTFGGLIDPFGGEDDIHKMILRCVGDPKERFLEDALRVVRALRFSIVKGFKFADDLKFAMRNLQVLDALTENIAVERIREELVQCFRHDPIATLDLLAEYKDIRKIIFDKGLNLEPTLGKV